MRKNSDYFANNQLLLAENVGFEKYFCEKCDFCPFLGDFRHFWILFRQGVGRKTENGTDAKPRAEGACTLCRGAKEEKPAKQD